MTRRQVRKEVINVIESLANEQVKKIVKWKKSAKARREENIFLAEGPKMVGEALSLGLAKQVYLTEDFLKREDKFVNEFLPGFSEAEGKGNIQPKPGNVQKKPGDAAGAFVQLVSPAVFAQMSDTVTPQGILCVAERPDYQLPDILRKKELSLLVLEDVQDPGNVGTMLRTAEAAGVDAVIFSKGCVDAFSPKVVRSTMGAIFRLPFFVAEDFPGELRTLKEAGIRFYAAHLQGTKDYHEECFSGRTAILIGNESRGLTKETSALADVLVKIPMLGEVESLNASVAAALLMYERRFPHRQ